MSTFYSFSKRNDFLVTSDHLGWSELVKMTIFGNFNGTTEFSGEFGTKFYIECVHSIVP